MFVVGLTGGIASGKSTVSHYLSQAGYPVLDADRMNHQLLAEDAQVIDQIAQTFGPQVLGADGAIDRAQLGQEVFGDPGALAKLEAITHPKIKAQLAQERASLAAQGQTLVFIDMPLLFEIGYQDQVDQVWLVYLPQDLQIQRLMARDNLSRQAAQSRLDSQWPLDDKLPLSQVVLDNSGSRKETQAQVQEALDSLMP